MTTLCFGVGAHALMVTGGAAAGPRQENARKIPPTCSIRAGRPAIPALRMPKHPLSDE